MGTIELSLDTYTYGYHPLLIETVTFEQKNKILNSKIPIAVKISPDISENQVQKISEILLKHQVEAIIVSNTSDSSRDNLINIQKSKGI